MNIRLRLFAGACEAAGATEISVDLPRGANYGELAAAAAAACPALAELLARSRLAAGAEFVTPNQPVDPTLEIALIPPVSGG